MTDDGVDNSCVIVAIPGPNSAPVQEDGQHITLCYLGEPALDQAEAEEYANTLQSLWDEMGGAFSVDTLGTGFLGDDEDAHVLLLDKPKLTELRDMIMALPGIEQHMAKTEQYPDYTPHMTLGYKSDGYTPGLVSIPRIDIVGLGIWNGLVQDNTTNAPMMASAGEWIDKLHPRGKDGKFIRKFGIVKFLSGLNGNWEYGKVVGMSNPDSGLKITVRPSDLSGTPTGKPDIDLPNSKIYAAPTAKAKMTTTGMVKTGGQAGSNPGGFYDTKPSEAVVMDSVPTKDFSEYSNVSEVKVGDRVQWASGYDDSQQTTYLKSGTVTVAGEDGQEITVKLDVGEEVSENVWHFQPEPAKPAPDKFYVKTAKSDKHGQNEALANALYEEAGVAVPEVSYNPDTKEIFSKVIPNSKQDAGDHIQSQDTAWLTRVHEDFVVDAWLANWDVFGMTNDNVLTTEDGTPVRIDNGGALLFRAQGAAKGSAFTSTVGELESLKAKRPQVYKDMEKSSEIDGAQRVVAISPERIEEMVSQHNLPKSLADTLKARRQFIAATYNIPLPESLQPAGSEYPTSAPLVDPVDDMLGGGMPRKWSRQTTDLFSLAMVAEPGDSIRTSQGTSILGTLKVSQEKIDMGTHLAALQAEGGPFQIYKNPTGLRIPHNGVFPTTPANASMLAELDFERGDRLMVNGEVFNVLGVNRSTKNILLAPPQKAGATEAPYPFVLNLLNLPGDEVNTIRWNPEALSVPEPEGKTGQDLASTQAIKADLVEPIPDWEKQLLGIPLDTAVEPEAEITPVKMVPKWDGVSAFEPGMDQMEQLADFSDLQPGDLVMYEYSSFKPDYYIVGEVDPNYTNDYSIAPGAFMATKGWEQGSETEYAPGSAEMAAQHGMGDTPVYYYTGPKDVAPGKPAKPEDTVAVSDSGIQIPVAGEISGQTLYDTMTYSEYLNKQATVTQPGGQTFTGKIQFTGPKMTPIVNTFEDGPVKIFESSTIKMHDPDTYIVPAAQKPKTVDTSGKKNMVLGDGTKAETGDKVTSKVDGQEYTFVKPKGPYAVVTDAAGKEFIKKASTMEQPGKAPDAAALVAGKPVTADGKEPVLGMHVEAKDGKAGEITMISPDGKFVFFVWNGKKVRKSVGTLTVLWTPQGVEPTVKPGAEAPMQGLPDVQYAQWSDLVNGLPNEGFEGEKVAYSALDSNSIVYVAHADGTLHVEPYANQPQDSIAHFSPTSVPVVSTVGLTEQIAYPTTAAHLPPLAPDHTHYGAMFGEHYLLFSPQQGTGYDSIQAVDYEGNSYQFSKNAPILLTAVKSPQYDTEKAFDYNAATLLFTKSVSENDTAYDLTSWKAKGKLKHGSMISLNGTDWVEVNAVTTFEGKDFVLLDNSALLPLTEYGGEFFLSEAPASPPVDNTLKVFHGGALSHFSVLQPGDIYWYPNTDEPYIVTSQTSNEVKVTNMLNGDSAWMMTSGKNFSEFDVESPLVNELEIDNIALQEFLKNSMGSHGGTLTVAGVPSKIAGAQFDPEGGLHLLLDVQGDNLIDYNLTKATGVPLLYAPAKQPNSASLFKPTSLTDPDGSITPILMSIATGKPVVTTNSVPDPVKAISVIPDKYLTTPTTIYWDDATGRFWRNDAHNNPTFYDEDAGEWLTGAPSGWVGGVVQMDQMKPVIAAKEPGSVFVGYHDDWKYQGNETYTPPQKYSLYEVTLDNGTKELALSKTVGGDFFYVNGNGTAATKLIFDPWHPQELAAPPVSTTPTAIPEVIDALSGLPVQIQSIDRIVKWESSNGAVGYAVQHGKDGEATYYGGQSTISLAKESVDNLLKGMGNLGTGTVLYTGPDYDSKAPTGDTGSTWIAGKFEIPAGAVVYKTQIGGSAEEYFVYSTKGANGPWTMIGGDGTNYGNTSFPSAGFSSSELFAGTDVFGIDNNQLMTEPKPELNGYVPPAGAKIYKSAKSKWSSTGNPIYYVQPSINEDFYTLDQDGTLDLSSGLSPSYLKDMLDIGDYVDVQWEDKKSFNGYVPVAGDEVYQTNDGFYIAKNSGKDGFLYYDKNGMQVVQWDAADGMQWLNESPYTHVWPEGQAGTVSPVPTLHTVTIQQGSGVYAKMANGVGIESITDHDTLDALYEATKAKPVAPGTKLFYYKANTASGSIYYLHADGTVEVTSPNMQWQFSESAYEVHEIDEAHGFHEVDLSTVSEAPAPVVVPEPDGHKASEMGPANSLSDFVNGVVTYVPDNGTWFKVESANWSPGTGMTKLTVSEQWDGSKWAVIPSGTKQVMVNEAWVKAGSGVPSVAPVVKPLTDDKASWPGEFLKGGEVPKIGMQVTGKGPMSGVIVSISKDKTKVTVLTDKGVKSSRQISALSFNYMGSVSVLGPVKSVDIPEHDVAINKKPVKEIFADLFAAKSAVINGIMNAHPGILKGYTLATNATAPSGKKYARVTMTLSKEQRKKLVSMLSMGQQPNTVMGDWAKAQVTMGDLKQGQKVSFRYSSSKSKWIPNKAATDKATHEIVDVGPWTDGKSLIVFRDLENPGSKFIEQEFTDMNSGGSPFTVYTYEWDPNVPAPIQPASGQGKVKISAAAASMGWAKVESGDQLFSSFEDNGGKASNRVLLVEPGNKVTSGKGISVYGSSLYNNSVRAKLADGTVIEVSNLDTTDNYSSSGMVVISIPEGGESEKAYGNALAALGMDYIPTTQASIKASVLPMLRGLVKVSPGDLETLGGMSEATIFKKIGEPIGIDDVGWQDVSVRLDPNNGAPAYYWSDRVREAILAKNNWDVVQRGASSGDADRIMSVVKFGSPATNIRNVAGLGGSGISVSQDNHHNTSGGSYMSGGQMTYNNPSGKFTQNNKMGMGGGQMMVVHQPAAVLGRILPFQPSYGHSDLFGVGHSGSSMIHDVTIGQAKNHSSDFYVGSGMGSEGIAFIGVYSENQKTQAIARLAKEGITHLNGRPLDEVIKPYSEFTQLKPVDMPKWKPPSDLVPILDLPTQLITAPVPELVAV